MLGQICKQHSEAYSHLCLQKQCLTNRVACISCLDDAHKSHKFASFKQLDQLLIGFGLAEGDMSYSNSLANSQSSMTLHNVVALYTQYCSELVKNIQNKVLVQPGNLLGISQVLSKFSRKTIFNYCWQLLTQNNNSQFQYLLDAINFIKYLREQAKLRTKEEFQEVLICIEIKVKEGVQELKAKVSRAFAEFNQNIRGGIDKWAQIYRDKHSEKFRDYNSIQNKDNLRKKNQIKQTGDKPEQIYHFKYSELGNMQIDNTTQLKIEMMFAQIFGSNKSIDGQQTKADKIHKQHKNITIRQQSKTNINCLSGIPHQNIKNHIVNDIKVGEKGYTFPFFNVGYQQSRLKLQGHYPGFENIYTPQNGQDMQAIVYYEEQNSKKQLPKKEVTPTVPIYLSPQMLKYLRVVITAEDITKSVQKQAIIEKISKIAQDPNYIQNLRMFIIEGPNQFDLKCLELLANHFPKLVKFNFIWNFEEEGLRLQKQQIFFEKNHSMQKNRQDLKMSEQLLQLYSRFPNLQNIQITDLQQFAIQCLHIENRNLKHLTLGSYIQSWQDQILPACLKRQALAINNLITLNIFNVKIIDGGFMERVIQVNRHSLKNIWLSECIQLQDSFIQAIRNSFLQSIILEQIKSSIKATISVPQTIQTLILQNCQISNMVPLQGLKSARNLTNFSIFQSNFNPEHPNIGDSILSQLSSIQAPKLKYLNVGECRSVTDQAIESLQKMQKLRQICIDNTSITLQRFAQSKICFYRLKKLGIVGLQASKDEKISNTSLQSQKLQKMITNILIKCPKLQTFSLKFTDEVNRIKKQAFKNIKHLSLTAKLNKKQYKSKNLKDFIQVLKVDMKKSINIV